MSLTDAAAFEKEMRAKLAELDLKERTGELVEARQVELTWVELVTRSRTKLLGVPAKLKTRLPHLTREDLRALDSEIRQALEELANSGGPDAAV